MREHKARSPTGLFFNKKATLSAMEYGVVKLLKSILFNLPLWSLEDKKGLNVKFLNW